MARALVGVVFADVSTCSRQSQAWIHGAVSDQPWWRSRSRPLFSSYGPAGFFCLYVPLLCFCSVIEGFISAEEFCAGSGWPGRDWFLLGSDGFWVSQDRRPKREVGRWWTLEVLGCEI